MGGASSPLNRCTGNRLIDTALLCCGITMDAKFANNQHVNKGGIVPTESAKNNAQQSELRELILATNRTTHAVRAFVSFLFIQLAAITLALTVSFLGQVAQDPSECSYGICPPNDAANFFAGLIWIAGVIWSSNVGWKELAMSRVPNGSPEGPSIKADDAKSKSTSSNVASTEFPGDTKRCTSCGRTSSKLDYVCRYCSSSNFES